MDRTKLKAQFATCVAWTGNVFEDLSYCVFSKDDKRSRTILRPLAAGRRNLAIYGNIGISLRTRDYAMRVVRAAHADNHPMTHKAYQQRSTRARARRGIARPCIVRND